MQVIRYTPHQLTSEDQQHLHHLELVVERAIADGKVTKYEIEEIKSQIYSHRDIAVYELELVRDRVLFPIQAGELEWEWD
ncbi:MAG: hypothetical protein AAFY26_22135 [Cyanobacteria bacterium J06638_22]